MVTRKLDFSCYKCFILSRLLQQKQMSFPAKMRAVSCSVFLLLLCLLALTGAKRQPAQDKRGKSNQPPPSPQPAKRPRSRSVLSSGELTTKDGHRCTWQTSGEGLVTLLVNCSSGTEGDQERYWCRYAGKPDLCQAYGVKSSQYWKQLVGKLKKRGKACGEKFLKAKTCKKAPPEAHMKLAQQSGGEEKKGGKEGGKKKGVAAEKSADGEKVQKKKSKKEEEEEKKRMEDKTGFEEERLMNDMEPVQAYCSEGWHSVCSFFVKFFDG
ncbi:fibroblast growth factor-binding protein 2-like isoform X2 [Cololabis saira]|uniref:fibroblast growth factor-binding protein 2-like isoform X2 n=1 Tax=Cololabis saira TaxID=129043 RepID=UPI002AD27475|nr:fibroblast growth factor-binding protein 2-like isoform X2 [Cololabis saira]